MAEQAMPKQSPLSEAPGLGRLRASWRLRRMAAAKRLAGLRAVRPLRKGEGAVEATESIGDALEAVEREHVAALSREGLGEPVIALLRSWLEATVEVRLIQRDLEFSALLESELSAARPAVAFADDPLQPLSAVELGDALGVGDEAVRQRERAGELFSVLRPGRKRGREYPAFQVWPEIAGEPLKVVLSAFKGLANTAVYGFFSAPSELLGGLTPIEALAGRLTSVRDLPVGAEDLLEQDRQIRVAAVARAAEALAAVEQA